MALHEGIALQPGSIGVRAKLNGAQVYADYAGGPRECSFRQKSEPLAKGQLQPESNPEGLVSLSGEARWNVCFVTRESV
jgi:hypothetical protein